MSEEIPLFEVNPTLDIPALAARFATDRRVQIRDVLTDETAGTIHHILANETPWGLAWSAGDKPRGLRQAEVRAMPGSERQRLLGEIAASVSSGGYGFAYQQYSLVQALQEKWDEGGPHELLLEHINAEPFMELVRTVTGMPDLVKADAQATLYGPGQFLAVHNDSHVMEGWKVAYVLNLARDWHENWGGVLQFHDEEGDVIAGFKPRFNALNLFAVPQRHSVSFVPPFAPVGRYAITGWFRDR